MAVSANIETIFGDLYEARLENLYYSTTELQRIVQPMAAFITFPGTRFSPYSILFLFHTILQQLDQIVGQDGVIVVLCLLLCIF